jgi:hypothetical protein
MDLSSRIEESLLIGLISAAIFLLLIAFGIASFVIRKRKNKNKFLDDNFSEGSSLKPL